MQTHSLISVLSSRVRSFPDLTSYSQSFLRHKIWSLKSHCSLRVPMTDLTAVSRQRHGVVIDSVGKEDMVLTLSSTGHCLLMSAEDLDHAQVVNRNREQILYMLDGDDQLFLVSQFDGEDWVSFWTLNYRDVKLTCTDRTQCMKTCKVQTQDIICVDKAECAVVVRRPNSIEVWGLHESKVTRSVQIPKHASRVCYDNGSVAYVEESEKDVIIHIFDSCDREVRICLRGVSTLEMFDLASNYVVFQVRNQPLQAVNIRSGLKFPCPKNTKKVLSVPGRDPLLIDASGVLMSITDWQKQYQLPASNVDICSIDRLDAFLISSPRNNTVTVISQELRLEGTITVPKGDKVVYCGFNQETYEVILATQKGRLQIWH